MHKHLLFGLAAAALASATASAQLPFVEPFTGGSNSGSWTLGPPSTFPSTGGNPTWVLQSTVDTFAPQPRSQDANSPFGGDWRAKGVRSVGIDLRTLAVQFPFDRELTLMLGNDNGTPADPLDDCIVYFLGTRRVPQVAEGWKSFDFFVDSASTSMPPGWALSGQSGSCTDANAAWNTVITDVSYVQYFYGNPEFFFIFDMWTVGLDNARISGELPTSNYCVSKPNSQGCSALMSQSGTPSASSASPFLLQASQVLNQKNGILIYGFAPWNVPFQGGTLCIAGQVRRTAGQNSGGTVGGPDCSGTYSFNFNAHIQGGSDPLLVAGEQVFTQYWYRDPVSPSGTGLSDASQFTIQP
jgi:hypothetical protein